MQEGQGGSGTQPPEHAGAWSALPAEGNPTGQSEEASGAGAQAEPAEAAAPGEATGASWAPAPAEEPPAAGSGWAPAGGGGGWGAASAAPGGGAGQPPWGGTAGYGQPGATPPWGTPPGGQPPWAPPPGYGGYGQPPQRPQRLARALVLVLVVMIAAGVGALAATLATSGHSAGPTAGVSPQQVPSPNSAPPGSTNTSAINAQAVADKVNPGVVDITARLHYTGQVFEGTGMVLNSSGLVLTNNHVVAGSTHLTATLVGSGRSYTATVVGTDAAKDVALLKLAGASGLKTVQVGNSAKVTLGTPVVAIGNAGGNGGSPTVAVGAITALNRNITASDAGSNTSEKLYGMLQTNAAIAEGDSGGPLADASGQVIGMDTAANTQSLGGPQTFQGFAIPINRALAIARQMAAGHGNGEIRIGLPAFMGVAVAGLPAGTPASPQQQFRALEQQASAQFGGVINGSQGCLARDTSNPVPSAIAPVKSGTLVGGVFCGEPAAAAGMRGGDVITAVNGRTITAPITLTHVLATYRPGDTVSVTWVDANGKTHTSSVKLTSGPAK